MANLARKGARNPKVKAYATDSFQNDGSVAGIDRVLRSIFHYRDEIEEIVRTPAFMMADLEEFGYLEGDCDDIATLAAAMTKSLDIPTRLTAMQSEPDGEFDHVFSEARIGIHWIPIDPTVAEGTVYQMYSIMTEMV